MNRMDADERGRKKRRSVGVDADGKKFEPPRRKGRQGDAEPGRGDLRVADEAKRGVGEDAEGDAETK